MKLLLLAFGLLVAAGLALGVYYGPKVEPAAREWVIEQLSQKFNSDVDIQRLTVSLFPKIQLSGEGLVLRHKGKEDVPPLISIEEFTAFLEPTGLFDNPRRIRRVVLRGLQLQIPPRKKKKKGMGSHTKGSSKAKRPQLPPVVIEEIVADGTLLRIHSKKPGKEPLEFDIRQLNLTSVSNQKALSFSAVLDNAKPPGLINTRGQFGPWNAEEPGQTSVSGVYTFRNADLSVFRGIGGTLSSDGRYTGMLSRIDVVGTTETPDFTLTSGGNPVPLQTEFHTIVDGTSGDTLLEAIYAHLGDSAFGCRGGVTRTQGVRGKTVAIETFATDARLDDFLRLAVKSEEPVLSGDLSFDAKLLIPPGEAEVVERMSLVGEFRVGEAVFSSETVQEKVKELSRRGSGLKKERAPENVASDFKGKFLMDDAAMSFEDLSFSVPGALVALDGSYGIKSEELDFEGSLRLEAKVSQTTTGIKSFFLKAVDPLLSRKGAGTYLPIKVTGTRSEPSFKVQLGKVLTRRD